MNNSRIVRESRRCLDLLSGQCNVTLVWVHGPKNMETPSRRARHELPESSLVDLWMPFTSVKPTTAGKLFQDANLSWVNEEYCSNPSLTSPSMDKRRSNQLLGFGVCAYWLLCCGKVAYRMQLLFNDFCHGCRFSEEEETVVSYFCQCPSLTRCRFRLFDSLIYISLMMISFINVQPRVILY